MQNEIKTELVRQEFRLRKGEQSNLRQSRAIGYLRSAFAAAVVLAVMSTITAQVLLVKLRAERLENEANKAWLTRLEAKAAKVEQPNLAAVCPAWFFETNIKVAKREICGR